MFSIRLLPEFAAWFDGLKDGLSKRRLARRLEKATLGNLGDVKPVDEGVFAMHEHFGPGWRMYYVQRGWRGADRHAGRWRKIHAAHRHCQGRETRGNP